MSHAKPAAGDTNTAEAPSEATYANEPTATGRRETEYQDPARAGDRGAADPQAPASVRDESHPDDDRPQRTAADEPARMPSDGNLVPGQDLTDPTTALWGTDQVQQYRGQLRDLQLTFVEDPKQAISGAASLVDEAITSLTNALKTQKQALDGWQVPRGEDTEVMRVALRRYRDFLNRLLSL